MQLFQPGERIQAGAGIDRPPFFMWNSELTSPSEYSLLKSAIA